MILTTKGETIHYCMTQLTQCTNSAAPPSSSKYYERFLGTERGRIPGHKGTRASEDEVHMHLPSAAALDRAECAVRAHL